MTKVVIEYHDQDALTVEEIVKNGKEIMEILLVLKYFQKACCRMI